jgi:hypothetical protein
MTSSNGQLSEQLSRGQFDQIPSNLLSHTLSGSYSCKPLNDPPSTMHKWGDAKISNKENVSLMQSQESQRLEDNDLKRIAIWQL